MINGAVKDPEDEGTTLGLLLKRSGTSKHINNKIKEARAQTNRLKRFSKMPCKTKIRLYKTLIRPIMEYPPVPVHLAPKTTKKKIQAVQNMAIRWATGDRRTNIEVLHERLKMEPMNIRIERQAKKVWEKIRGLEEEIYEDLTNVHQRRIHPWWPRSIPAMDRDEQEIWQ